jgi:hypothetical protein
MRIWSAAAIIEFSSSVSLDATNATIATNATKHYRDDRQWKLLCQAKVTKVNRAIEN